MAYIQSRGWTPERQIRNADQKNSRPTIDANGKPFLDWEKGMPLHKFLSLVCRREAGSSLESLDKRVKAVDLSTVEDSEPSQLRITDMVRR